MWVHEQGLGGEQWKLEAWDDQILARKALLKKSAFLMLEREGEMSKHGWLWWAESGAKEAQGQAQASPRILAQEVRLWGVCVLDNFTL